MSWRYHRNGLTNPTEYLNAAKTTLYGGKQIGYKPMWGPVPSTKEELNFEKSMHDIN